MAIGSDRRTMVHTQTRAGEIDVGLRSYMLRVYNYMCGALAISGLTAYALAITSLGSIFFNEAVTAGGRAVLVPNVLGWIGMFAPLGILLFAMFRYDRMSLGAAQGLFWLFAALQGVGLALILQMYTGQSVARAFFVTASAFAGLSLYGYTTRRDLSGFGSFLIMGVIGLVIAMIVNMFLASSAMDFVITGAGVLIFAGLTAYKTQEIKLAYSEANSDEVQGKIAVMGAWSLFITFINLFLFILRIVGNRQ